MSHQINLSFSQKPCECVEVFSEHNMCLEFPGSSVSGRDTGNAGVVHIHCTVKSGLSHYLLEQGQCQLQKPGVKRESLSFLIEMELIQGFPGGSVVKNPPAIQEMQVRSLNREDPLEREMATHPCILVWEIPQTDEPGGLQSLGCKSQTRLSD